nr:hypothetical protein [Tanacetum cinerariifolium]
MFEDILGDTTNTVDTNRVEADLSSMETSIIASPTPTFRIHKDHPKSQIIGPVDTPEEPKKIFDALKDPSWVEAMHEELLQFKIQNVWILVDCPKEMDVKSAFLYGTIDEEVYVKQPPRFQDLEFPDRVYKVEKAMGTINQTLFIRKYRGDFLLVQVYVDDIIFGSSNPQLCREFEALMHEKFQMSAMVNSTSFLGKDGPGKDVELHLYRSMIGSLMYLTASRPDIMFVVCACARRQVTPKECHLYVIKRIFRYLKGHPKLGLWYPKESPFDLVAYSDSDYGGATQDRKSTIGGYQFLRRRLISWQCKKQTIVATSTTEAEYVAAASSCGQVLWIQNQMLDYGPNTSFYLLHNPNKSEHNIDFHNMIAILEISEHNIDFHQIVDFIEASHIRYALTINLNVYVSHIRQFWSTARIETTNEGTKILATMDGKPRTIFESLIRRSLKLNDEDEISSLPDAELFENLALIGYNILPNQRFTFEKGQFSHQWKATRIAQSKALSTAADEPASLLRDDNQGEAFPNVSSLDAGHDRENIIKTSALPCESTPRVTSLDADEGTQDLEISNLKARIKILQDKDRGNAEPSRDGAPINGRSMEIGEEVGVEKSTRLGSNDTKEMVNVLSSMEAANILTSGVAAVSVPPVAEVSTVGVPTVSGLVPTVRAIFTTASVVTPYSRRPRGISTKDKGKEKVVKSDTPKKKKLQEQIDAQVAKEIEEEIAREDQRMNEQLTRDAKIARLHAEEELKIMIEGLDKSNEMIEKHLQEYEQSEAELTIGEKIELINELVKYQDHHAKILKYQAQQSKPLSKKEQRESYMSVLRSHAG